MAANEAGVRVQHRLGHPGRPGGVGDDDRVVRVVPVVRRRRGRVARAGLRGVPSSGTPRSCPASSAVCSSSASTPTPRRRRMYSAAISGRSLPFISAGIAPSRASARKLSTMSAAAVAQTATGSRGRTPCSCSQAARAATRSSSWPSVSGVSAGCAVDGGVEGQAGPVRVGAVRQHPGQDVARPELGVGGQRAAQSFVSSWSCSSPSSTASASVGVRRVPVRSGSATPRRRRRRRAAGRPRRAVGVRVAGRAEADHRPAQTPAGRDVPGDAVRHGLEEEQRADPPAGLDGRPVRARRWRDRRWR